MSGRFEAFRPLSGREPNQWIVSLEANETRTLTYRP